jgi:4-amino-4-deoxy-L-arabinose transferase-like glycosyltransferase
MGLFRRWAISILFYSAVLVYGAGLFTDIMEVDAAQYASLSREMAETGDYLEIHHRGNDYLDKPPFLFWVSSVFIEVFGPHNWSYKLASFLFSILGIVSTYKLGHLLYNKRIGFVAAIMLATSQAYFLFNHDIRTDTILTSSVIFAVWQIMAFTFYRERMHLIGGFIGIGIGMLTKGPIALMVPVLAFASYFIGRKRYSLFFRWEWLLGLGIVLVMLSPMVFGLYNQYDKHPEKEILFMSDAGNRTETEVSGVKFYFWTQSFGRLTGDNVWKDGSPPTYFIDTFLWSFLPWSLLAIWALLWRTGNTLVDVVKKRKKQEWLTLGGFILPFIAFSMSSYKLPHYIFVLFPFAAIITSEFVLRVLFEKPAWWGNIMRAIQIIVVAAIGAVSVLLLTFVFPTTNWLVWLLFIGLYATAVYSLFSKERIIQVVLSSALAVIAANWVLNAHFYPELFKYQPGHAMARFVEENNIPKDQIFIYPSFSFFTFEYYADHTFLNVSNERLEKSMNEHGSAYVYVKKDYLHVLEGRYLHTEIVTEFDAFHVSMLTTGFLNPATRDAELGTQYLVKITP